jgi:hypothetical protein
MERLLDLTTRNRLLSFTHSVAGCLRVVDELPDQLFTKLLEGEGATPHQIAAVTGHENLDEIERYTREAAQPGLAASALSKIGE